MMKNEFTEIIETLEIEDSQLENMRRRIVKACSNPESTNQIILLFESKSANLCICADTFIHKPICSVGYEPYCLFFKAYANYCKGGYQEALELSIDAYDCFKTKSQPTDQALTLWAMALAHIKLGQFNFAKTKLENAIDILNESIQKHKNLGKYSKLVIIEKINVQIAELLTAILDREHKAHRSFVGVQPKYTNKQPDSKRTTKPFPWKPSEVIFPVYNYVRAGKEGNYIFDDQPELTAVINEVLVNEKPHQIYNIRHEGFPIKLKPMVYRWFRVEGNSMNRAEPIPINHGDYVLTIELSRSDYVVQFNDVVIAAVKNPTDTESAGVIKRYTSKGLISVSSRSYSIIPLGEVRICGVVIAVAKPLLSKTSTD